MRQLLTLLIRKANGEWWELRSGEGNPPEERVGMYVFPVVIGMILRKLQRVHSQETENEEHP